MRSGRNILLSVIAITFFSIMTSTAFAGVGFGGDASSKCGLDLNKGYDVNTVTTVTGKIIATSHHAEDDHMIFQIKSGYDIINLCVGPHDYWNKNGITLNANDTITAKGSKAQGKDGKTYLLIQKIENRTTGTQATLRNDVGEPAWMGANMRTMRSGGASGMAGGMMGSGGGSSNMMRNGGGMMRR